MVSGELLAEPVLVVRDNPGPLMRGAARVLRGVKIERQTERPVHNGHGQQIAVIREVERAPARRVVGHMKDILIASEPTPPHTYEVLDTSGALQLRVAMAGPSQKASVHDAAGQEIGMIDNRSPTRGPLVVRFYRPLDAIRGVRRLKETDYQVGYMRSEEVPGPPSWEVDADLYDDHDVAVAHLTCAGNFSTVLRILQPPEPIFHALLVAFACSLGDRRWLRLARPRDR